MKKTAFPRILDYVVLALSVLLLVGSFTFFRACGAKEGGDFMNCHKAQVAITVVGCILTAISVLILFVKGRSLRIAVFSCMGIASVFTMFIPNVIVRLCMMKSMRCHTVMRPWTIVFCSMLLLVSAFEAIVSVKGGRR